MNKRPKLWAAIGTLAIVLIICIPLAGCSTGSGRIDGGVYAKMEAWQP